MSFSAFAIQLTKLKSGGLLLLRRNPALTRRAVAYFCSGAHRLAAPMADMTIMFDNSRSIDKAFSLVRAQTGAVVTYDCRDRQFGEEQELIDVADTWLSKVAPL